VINRSLTAIAVTAALALAGCNGKTTRSDIDDETAGTGSPAATAAAKPTPMERIVSAKPNQAVAPPSKTNPPAANALTGIAACDDYLSRYRACHRTLAVYDEATIESRLAQLRNTLIADTIDPTKRDMVETRCTSLQADMTEALAGRECDFDPVATR
jgi:hypothetical protein